MRYRLTRPTLLGEIRVASIPMEVRVAIVCPSNRMIAVSDASLRRVMEQREFIAMGPVRPADSPNCRDGFEDQVMGVGPILDKCGNREASDTERPHKSLRSFGREQIDVRGLQRS